MSKPSHVVPLSTFKRGLAKGHGMLMPVRFRLYPNGRSTGLFLVVQVWPALKYMRQYITSTYPGNGSYRNTLGMCSSFKVVSYAKGKSARASGIFAELNLNAANLTMRIITHELFHATMAYARRMGLDLSEISNGSDDHTGPGVCETEESLTTVHGTLCSDFVARASDLGFYRQSKPTPWKPFTQSA